MSKYAPLEEYLTSQEEKNVTITYEEMENLVGFKLPNSAYKHRAWWSNGKKGGSKFWLRVGWLVDSVQLGELVTFRKAEEIIEEPHPEHEHVEEEGFEVMLSLDMADVPMMIKDLHALMLEGIISREEFDEKKLNLLGLL